jgi:predicted DsbA family dithiol-disulfide isomerase
VTVLVVYGDFNCPFSALASARAAELERRGTATFEWRAVEHDPRIPPRGVPVVGEIAEQLRAELDQIRGLLRPGEPDRLRLPTRQVNTAMATSRFAGTGSTAGAAVREAVFAAHWERSEAIDDELTLDRLGLGHADVATTDAWRSSWHQATSPIVPVLVLPDGYVSRGLGALTRLGSMLDD